jgi:hypothetical protein
MATTSPVAVQISDSPIPKVTPDAEEEPKSPRRIERKDWINPAPYPATPIVAQGQSPPQNFLASPHRSQLVLRCCL